MSETFSSGAKWHPHKKIKGFIFKLQIMRVHKKKIRTKNPEELFFVKEPMRVLQSTKRALRILGTNYVATSTDELCEKQTHLQPMEMDKLKKLLKKYHTLFDGKLGTMTGTPIQLEIKKGKNR